MKGWVKKGKIPYPAEVVWKQGLRILLEEEFRPARKAVPGKGGKE